MGMIIMRNFEYDSENEWDDGTSDLNLVMNTGTMTLTSKNNLNLRGYVGPPLGAPVIGVVN